LSISQVRSNCPKWNSLKAHSCLESRLHVKILDPEEQAYQVAESVFPRPSGSSSPSNSLLGFKYTADPFTFAVVRKSTNETLFDSSAASLIFENQYLRLRTRLPSSPHLYGLGEHTDPFQLNTTNYTRTLWNRDAYGIRKSYRPDTWSRALTACVSLANGTNLYGDHPVYFDHRGEAGTHAVFLLNSNGKDIKIDNSDGQFLEYNTLGGILDLYFLAG
jgi:alpha-glucosidase